MIARELQACLPERLRYERVALADEANALGPWQAAIAKYRAMEFTSPGVSLLLYGCMEEETPQPPTEEDWREVEAWISANAEAIELLDAGIKRGRLQLPFDERPATETERIMTPTVELREFGKLLSLRLRAARRRKELSAAADDGMRLLQLGNLIVQGEGASLDLTLGTIVRGMALRDIADLGSRQELPQTGRSMLAAALANVAPLEEAIWSAARVDLCGYGLSTLALVPESNDAATLRDRLLEHFYDSGESLKSMAKALEETPPDDAVLEERVEQRKRQLTTLLEGHPCLFDRAATAQLLGEMVRDQVESSLGEEPAAPNWPARWREKLRRRWRPTIDEQLKAAWPSALQPWFGLEEFGDDTAAVASRTELVEMMSGWDPALFVMLTDKQLAHCQKLLRGVDNPVGRMIANSLAGFCFLPKMLRDRDSSELEEAMRAMTG